MFLGIKPTLACFSLHAYVSSPRLLREEHLLISIIIYRIVKIEQNVGSIYSSRSSESSSIDVEWDANVPEERTWTTNLPFLLGCVSEATPMTYRPETKRKIIRFLRTALFYK